MYWVDFVALVLATGAPINAWLRDQGIFRGPREWLIAWGEIVPDSTAETQRPSKWERSKSVIAELAQCRFCLHYHSAFWLCMLFGCSLFLSPPWSTVCKLPIYSLAATRFSYWLSQYTQEQLDDRE